MCKQPTESPCLTGSISLCPQDASRLAEIVVPVLLIYADLDVGYMREGAEQQKAHYSGTDDLTWAMLENTGHFPIFERTAPTLRSELGRWLGERW